MPKYSHITRDEYRAVAQQAREDAENGKSPRDVGGFSFQKAMYPNRSSELQDAYDRNYDGPDISFDDDDD